MNSLNQSINWFAHTGIFKIIRIISEEMETMGKGMERQHDEDIAVLKKPQKKTY